MHWAHTHKPYIRGRRLFEGRENLGFRPRAILGSNLSPTMMTHWKRWFFRIQHLLIVPPRLDSLGFCVERADDDQQVPITQSPLPSHQLSRRDNPMP